MHEVLTVLAGIVIGAVAGVVLTTLVMHVVFAVGHARRGNWWIRTGQPLPGLWTRLWWELRDPNCSKRLAKSLRDLSRRAEHQAEAWRSIRENARWN